MLPWFLFEEVFNTIWANISEALEVINNSIVLLPSKKGVLIYNENAKAILFTDLNDIKKFIKDKKPNIF